MRHIGHEQGPVLVSNLSEARIVQVAGIAAHPRNDQLRLEQRRTLLQPLVVNQSGGRIHLDMD